MAHCKNAPNLPFVVLDDNGFMKLFTQEGHELGGQIKLRVTDSVNDSSTAVVIMVVNIVKDKAEMLSEIERFKNNEC